MSKQKKKKVANGKPLMDMTPREFDEAWDSVSLASTILEEARVRQAPVRMAVLLLRSPGKRDLVVSHDSEYGDDYGVSRMIADKLELIRLNRLLPGETLHVVEVVIPIDLITSGAEVSDGRLCDHDKTATQRLEENTDLH